MNEAKISSDGRLEIKKQEHIIPTDLAINTLTLRDYFAAHAPLPIIDSFDSYQPGGDGWQRVNNAWAYADAMIAARAKEKP